MNMYKIRIEAQKRQAQALAANLYWCVTTGWAAVDGGTLGGMPSTDPQPSYRTSGRFWYSKKYCLEAGKVCVSFEMDVFSGEYKNALAKLEPWECAAIVGYFARPAVAALQRSEFERKNPDRHKTPKAPLYLVPPSLEHHIYTTQLAAFLVLASVLLIPPIIKLESK